MDICKFGCVKKNLDVNVLFYFYIYVVYQFVCLIFYVLNSIKIDENVLSIDFKDKISCLNFFSSEFYYVCYCYYFIMLFFDLEIEIFMLELKDFIIFFI